MTEQNTIYDLIIIGGSAAATSAGIYAARRKLHFKIISKDFGGEVATSGEIGNWPGMTHTDGLELSDLFLKHLNFLGVEPETDILVERITKQDNGSFLISTKAGDEYKEYEAKVVIVAAGVHPKELNIPGEKEFRNKGVSYCTVCLPPGSMITGNNEPRAIESFNIGDRVLTDDGTYQRILKIMKRPYEGDLIKLTSRLFLEEEVRLTPNHPVLVTSLEKGKSQNYFNFKWGELNWVPAGKLNASHLIVYPIVKEIEDIKRLKISEATGYPVENGLVKNKRETHTSKRIIDSVQLDKDLFRLAGYYLAEGSRKGYTTTFYFNRNEQEYIKDVVDLVKKYFGLSARVKYVDSVARIEVWSMIFSEFFDKLFSHYSYNKRLPHWVTILPLSKQKELIKGLWRGDGCRRYKDFVLVTNSQVLVAQVKNILLRFGIAPSIRKIGLDKLKPSKIGNRAINFKHPKYEITVGGIFLEKMGALLDTTHPRILTRKRTNSHVFIRKGYVILPIRKIQREFYKGPVYNLVVDKNHSYVTTNSTVHNCDGPLFGGKVTAVIGGGNSALEAGLMLADIASKVYIINKNAQFKGDQILIDNLKTKKNVEVIYNAITTEIVGNEFVTSLKYNKDGQGNELKVDGTFVHIGMVPNSGIVPAEVEKDVFGQIKVNANCETNVPGLYAAGDVTNVPFNQIVIAAGQGTVALLSAVNYLNRLQ